KISRFLAFKDAIDVACPATELVDRIRSIRNQAAVADEEAVGINGRQPVPGCQRYDQLVMNDRVRGEGHDEAAIRLTRKGGNAVLDLAGVSRVDRAQFHPERWSHGLDYRELADAGGNGRVPKDCRPRRPGCDLL